MSNAFRTNAQEAGWRTLPSGVEVMCQPFIDSETEVATKNWQAERGLVADGVVGGKSWVAVGQLAMPTGSTLGRPDVAPACARALADATARWPSRKRLSDGILGDASHQVRKSDHDLGNAVDITPDLAGGCAGRRGAGWQADERTAERRRT